MGQTAGRATRECPWSLRGGPRTQVVGGSPHSSAANDVRPLGRQVSSLTGRGDGQACREMAQSHPSPTRRPSQPPQEPPSCYLPFPPPGSRRPCSLTWPCPRLPAPGPLRASALVPTWALGVGASLAAGGAGPWVPALHVCPAGAGPSPGNSLGSEGLGHRQAAHRTATASPIKSRRRGVCWGQGTGRTHIHTVQHTRLCRHPAAGGRGRSAHPADTSPGASTGPRGEDAGLPQTSHTRSRRCEGEQVLFFPEKVSPPGPVPGGFLLS